MKQIIRILRAADLAKIVSLARYSALLSCVFLWGALFAQSTINPTPSKANLATANPLSASQFTAGIEAADDSYSAYDPRRMVQLDRYGRQQQEAGDHSQALVLYRQALHIARVNNGLYHDSQIELLDSIIYSEMALKDWDAVNDDYGYMEHLYRRLYTVDDAELDIGLRKVVAWHVRALNANLDDKRIEHLTKANSLFKLRLQVAEMTLSAGHPKINFLYRNIAISERQLYFSSSLNRERQRRQYTRRRNSILADLD